MVWRKKMADSNNYQKFLDYLKSLGKEDYKNFNMKIITTKYQMLGIKLPLLRKMAKEIIKGDYKVFLEYTTDMYYEEVMLKLFVIASIKEKEEMLKYFYSGIDLIDNWALCDSFCSSLKLVNKYKLEFLDIIKELVKSNKTYYIRVGLVLLLDYYVEEEYLNSILDILNNVNSDEYYVAMAMAWLIAEVFIKYPRIGEEYLKTNNLKSFVVNKAISKIRDSYRVDKVVKEQILQYKK